GRLGNRLRRCEIDGKGAGRTAIAPNCLGHAAETLLAAGEQQHAGAVFGVTLGRRLADAARAFSGLTDSLGGFPKFRESDSRGRLVKEASLYDPTSFD
ncbi:hypothetical protein LCGC14_2688390, partial [marine sediment metagenome]